MSVQTMIKFSLAPVLVWQGRQVRKRTPVLPEARGPRKGITGGNDRGLFRLLVIGDSAAAGVGVDHQENSLMGQILECIPSGIRVSWALWAKSGITTEQMVGLLEETPAVRFDVAVTSLGVNDVKAGVEPDVWLGLQQRLVSLLEKKFGIRHIVLSAVPPMNEFPALPWPLGWYLGRVARKMNQKLDQWTMGKNSLSFIPFDLPIDPVHMAEDGFHPGPVLHGIWARQVADRILSMESSPGD
ncbi:MAG: SGNH/GDSL hydrolase family protein [Desulfobacterales bacterium]|nr:SGNH/GDSL hydrolase family protein [Desulfobacterales bacterium]